MSSLGLKELCDELFNFSYPLFKTGIEDSTTTHNINNNSNNYNPYAKLDNFDLQQTLQISKIKIYSDNEFDLKLTSTGNSIFENLKLSATGYQKNTKKELDLIYKWKRIKYSTSFTVVDNTSNNYYPSSEDLGYYIEVEAMPKDSKNYKYKPARAKYGPLLIDNSTKRYIERLNINDSNAFRFVNVAKSLGKNNKNAVKITIQNANEILIEENNDSKNNKSNPNLIDVSICEIELNDKPKETTKQFPIKRKINYLNPNITLSSVDKNSLSLEFISSDQNQTNQTSSNTKQNLTNLLFDDIINKDNYIYDSNQKVEVKYELQCTNSYDREILFLLIRYYRQEHVSYTKNLVSNLLSYDNNSNNKNYSFEDIILEIKTTNEENNILINKKSTKDKEINSLKLEMANLEEDFRATLNSIYKNVKSDINNNNTDNYNDNSNSNNNDGDSMLNNDSNLLEILNDEERESKSGMKSLKSLSTKSMKSLNTLNSDFNNNLLKKIDMKQYNLLKSKFQKLADKFSKLNSREKGLIDKNKELERFNELTNKEILTNKEKLITITTNISNIEKELKSLKLNSSIEDLYHNWKTELDQLENENANLYKIKDDFEIAKDKLIDEHENKEKCLKEEQNVKNLEKCIRIAKIVSKNREKDIKECKLIQKKYTESIVSNSISNEKYEREIQNMMLELEKNKIKNKILENEKVIVKDNFTSLFTTTFVSNSTQNNNRKNSNKSSNMTTVKITQEELDEYEILRTEQEELESLIMQLQMNNAAKDLEIKYLTNKL